MGKHESKNQISDLVACNDRSPAAVGLIKNVHLRVFIFNLRGLMTHGNSNPQEKSVPIALNRNVPNTPSLRDNDRGEKAIFVIVLNI